MSYSDTDFLVLAPETIDYDRLKSRDPIFEGLAMNIPKGIISQVVQRTAYKVEKFKKKHKNIRKISGSLEIKICSNPPKNRKLGLKYIYGSGYTKGIRLLKSKVLYLSLYSEGNCYGYYFNNLHQLKNLRVDTLDTHTQLNRNIISRLSENSMRFKANHSANSQKFRPLLKFFKSKKLRIDTESALNQIQEKYAKSGNYGQYIIDMQKIIDLHNGIYRFAHNPDTDGRLHNNFNQLNKTLRHHLSYDGKKLVEIDLSNSVPFILSSILSDNILFDYSKVISPIINSHTSMFLKNLESLDLTEVEALQKESVKGTLYESLENDYETYFFPDLIMEFGYYEEDGTHKYDRPNFRNIIKGDLIAMIFAKNKQYKDMQEVFGKTYPTVLQFIRKAKKKKFKRLSHFLFQIESHIMLELIAKGFNQQQRGRVPIFTIHDCIVTTEGNEHKLKEYMETTFNKIFKNPPSMKMKYWSESKK